MSCFAKIKSPVTGQSVTSPAYYQLTSFFNQSEGKRIYQATTSNTFKTNFGFDWTKPHIGYSEKINYAGEPKMREINKHLNLGMSELELRSAEQIEEIGALGYLGRQFNNKAAFDNILFEVQLNPKFDMINAEVISVGNKFQLSVKPVVGEKVEGGITKDMLTRYKFPDFVVNSVQDFNNASFKELVDGLAQSKEIEPFQKEMLERLSPLIGKNTKLKLAVFDDFNVADEFQRSFFDPKTNTVFIAKSVTTPVNNQFLIREIIHEAVHAFTIEVLKNPRNAAEVQFVQEMQQYFDRYTTYYATLNDEYGLKNIEEFVAEFLSNPYFRQTLQDEELRRSKSVGIIDRMWNSIKNFLSRYLFGNVRGTMFDQVQETLNDYFDYLSTLQDFPQTYSETQVRFSQPFGQRQQKPEIYNRLKKFYDFVDQTVTGKVWGQLAQSFQEASPEFNSIRAIQDKFGLISTSNISDSLKASVAYVQAVDQLLTKVEKDLDIAIKGKNYYEAEKLLTRYNSILVIAETFQQQLNYFQTNLVDQLSFDILADFSQEQRIKVGEEKVKVKSEESYIESIRDEMKKGIDNARTRVDSLKRKAQENMVLPVAQVVSKMFSKIAADMQKPDHPIQKEKAELEERLARAQGNPRLEKKLKAELKDIETALSFTPTVDNIKKLLNAATDQSLRYTSIISKYFAVGGQTGVPIVDIVNAFINNHVTEATNKSLAVDTQIRQIQERINQRNRRKGIGRNLLKSTTNFKTSALAEFYKGFYRVVPIKYYQDGELRTINQKVYNTPMKEAEFQNDLADLKEALRQARNYGTEAELQEAQANLDQFVKDYAQREFVDEYYEAEELLTDEAREARQELRAEIDQIASVFGDEDLDLADAPVIRGSTGEPEPTTRELRAKLRRQYVRLGSIYNEDGSEKPIGSKERRIADSIIAYNKARKALDVVEFVISDDTLVKFTQIRNQFTTNISAIQADIAQLQSTLDAAQIANDIGLMDSTATKIDQKKEELKAEKEREKKWLEQNTRIEILPKFFEEQQALSDKIRDILSKYGENPEVTEKYERLFSAVRGYRDQDGVIEGTLVGEGLTKTIQELEQEIEDLKKEIKESQNITEQDKAELKSLFSSLYQLQTKTNTAYYYETANGIKDRIQFTQEEKLAIKNQALEEAQFFMEKQSFKTFSLFNSENFEPNDYFVGRSPEDFDPTTTDINDLTAMFENLLTAVEKNKKYRQTDWYKNNHIAITYEVKSGNQIILPDGTIQDQMIEKTEMRPIYIWRKTVPSNEKYIKRESPTFDWAVPRIREEYKNKDHRFLGDYRPRQNAKDNKYVNPEYEALDAEEKEIMNDILKIYESEQRVLPDSQRLRGYVMPNMAKESKEDQVDWYRGLGTYKFYYWWKSFKVFVKENIPNVGEEDEISVDILQAKAQLNKPNVRLIKTRFKEPLSDLQSTDNILGALSAFSVYSAEFHGLRKALPAVFAIRDKYAQNAGITPGRDTEKAKTTLQKFKKGVKTAASVVLGATAEQQQELILDQIDNQISRFFYGAELRTGSSQISRLVARSSTRVLNQTQKYALQFNLLRMPKNVVANVLNATGNRNKFGLTKQDMLNGMAKAAKKRAELIGLEQGLTDMTSYLAKIIYFRAIPMADPTQLSRSINSSFTMRYLNADSLNAQWFSSNEAISTLGIYEGIMAKTFVPYTDSLGNESSILLSDAYDYKDGQLVPKDGVMGINRTRLNELLAERDQYIADFLVKQNAATVKDLPPVKQVQLNKEIKAKFEVPIKAQEKFIESKINELKKVEQEVRDKIFSLYTATQGNYFKRGASYYESVIALKFLMSMKRWLYSGLKNYFGGKSFNVITGTLDEGFYRTFLNALRKQMSSLRIQSNQLSLDYSYTEREKAAAHRVAINLGNTAVLYMTTRLLATLAMAMIGDEEEDGSLEWIVSLLALMSLGSLDEYATLNPIIGPTTFYNKLKTDPLKKGYEDKGFFDSFGRSAIYAWFGQQTRALDQMLEGFGIIGEGIVDLATGNAPTYVERSRKGKGGEVPNPRVPFYRGRSKFLVGASKASGVELLIKSGYPGKKLEQLTKFTPIIGMPNPQGRLNVLLKDIDALEDKLTTRTNQDILSVSDLYVRDEKGLIKKTFDRKGRPIYEYDEEKLKDLEISTRDADNFAEIIDKLYKASLERDKLIQSYPSLKAYEENLRVAQAEGREASSTSAKILYEFHGYEKPKFEVSEKGTDVQEANRATQALYRKAIMKKSELIREELKKLQDSSAAEVSNQLLPE